MPPLAEITQLIVFGVLALAERVCLTAGLGELSSELGPVSQAPVDSHCFAGPGNRCPVQASINAYRY
jgi:hypothetical protein